jgi:hypothetical protein
LKEVRDFYIKTRGKTDAERWYLILADSKATETQWHEAAQNITRPTPVPPNSGEPNTKIPPGDPQWAEDRPLQGEPLRDRRQPSVSELLARRADEITTLDLNNTLRLHHLRAACDITLCLAKWDLKAALPEIRQRVEQCRALNNDRNFGPHATQLHSSLSQLIMTAVDAGATEFIDLYIAWLKERRPVRNGLQHGFNFLRPLSRYAERPEMAELATELFFSRLALAAVAGTFGAELGTTGQLVTGRRPRLARPVEGAARRSCGIRHGDGRHDNADGQPKTPRRFDGSTGPHCLRTR